MGFRYELTRQERCVLDQVAKGYRNDTIARELSISRRTVEKHLSHIFDKLGVSSRTEAVFYALQSGLVELHGMVQDTESQMR